MDSTPATTSPEEAECVQFRPEQLQLATGVPLGSGAISQILQCRLRCATAPSLPIVVKIVSKLQVLQQGKVQSVMMEKAALRRLAPFPYIARLYGTAQSEDELYFVMEWLPHGDLLQHIRHVARDRVRLYNEKLRDAVTQHSPEGATSQSVPSPEAEGVRCDLKASSVTTPETVGCSAGVTAIPESSTALRCLDFHDIQLITAQLVLALAHTARKGVVLRDLKPENVAFDEKYRACLLDFDTADLEGAAHAPESNGGVACPSALASGGASADREGRRLGDATTPERTTDASGDDLAYPPPPPPRRFTVSEIQSMRKKTASFCGTAQYVSPEMVGQCKWSYSSDLWALGALVYDMAYGRHLFSGMTQFEVLQKVVASGGYTANEALFPTIDFDDLPLTEAPDQGTASTREEPDPTSSASQGGRRFAALKAFVRELLSTDPLQRLGVHPETHRFDEEALRRHAFFADFPWASVEGQLRTFRQRSFLPSRAPGAATVNATPDHPCVSSVRQADSTDSDALPYDATALPTLEKMSVDPSASLLPLYHIRPVNDPAYAEYVYRATADANPFERLFIDNDAESASTNTGGDDRGAREETELRLSVPAETAGSANAASVTETATSSTASSARDEVDDVIDDVGMHYTGLPADVDFQD